MHCAICRAGLDITAHTDWEGGICDACWRRSNPITRGYLALCQELGEEVGWTDRYVIENNILWDLIVSQIRQSISGRPRVLVRERRRRGGR